MRRLVVPTRSCPRAFEITLCPVRTARPAGRQQHVARAAGTPPAPFWRPRLRPYTPPRHPARRAPRPPPLPPARPVRATPWPQRPPLRSRPCTPARTRQPPARPQPPALPRRTILPDRARRRRACPPARPPVQPCRRAARPRPAGGPSLPSICAAPPGPPLHPCRPLRPARPRPAPSRAPCRPARGTPARCPRRRPLHARPPPLQTPRPTTLPARRPRRTRPLCGAAPARRPSAGQPLSRARLCLPGRHGLRPRRRRPWHPGRPRPPRPCTLSPSGWTSMRHGGAPPRSAPLPRPRRPTQGQWNLLRRRRWWWWWPPPHPPHPPCRAPRGQGPPPILMSLGPPPGAGRLPATALTVGRPAESGRAGPAARSSLGRGRSSARRRRAIDQSRAGPRA